MIGFIMYNPTKMDDLGVPPFQETSIYAIWDMLLLHDLRQASQGNGKDLRHSDLCQDETCQESKIHPCVHIHRYTVEY